MNLLAQKICNELRNRIHRGDFASSGKLPALRILAKTFQISYYSVRLAIEQLSREGLIEICMGSGVILKQNLKIRLQNKAVSFKTKAQQIANTISHKIAGGDLKIGDYLPLHKMLKFQYQTTYNTINNVIGLLLKENLVHRQGSRFLVGNAPAIPNRKKNKAYLLVSQRPLDWKFWPAEEIIFLQALENELQKNGVTSLEYINIWDEHDFISRVQEASTFGLYIDFTVFINSGDSPETMQANFYKITETAAKKHLPVVVYSSNIILRYIPDFTFRRLPNLFIIGYNNYMAGEKLGTHLAAMGHKKIAYFNFGNVSWNTERFKGMENVLKRHFNSGLNLYHFQENSAEYKNANLNLSTYADTSKKDRKHFLASYSRLFKNHEFQTTDPVKEAYFSLGNQVYQDIYKKGMTPVFKKALNIKEITAWVGTGPTDTMAAAEFLTENKINIPDEISLVGFGNNEASMRYGITTYDLMKSKAGYLAAHCILGDIPIKKNRKGYVEYEGQVIIRKSVKAV
jgi:DNA-binding LacI/PurR family transcriptional regulator/DNA-binding FadR family transcriptional regulator